MAHKAKLNEGSIGNTKKAIYEAIKSDVDAIEIDVRLSKDKVPFIFHDPTLNKNTDGKGSSDSHNWSELSKVKFKRDNTQSIISLEEALKTINNKKMLFLDIKTAKIKNTIFIQKLLELIKNVKAENNVVVISFNPAFLWEFQSHAKESDIKLGFLLTQGAKALKKEGQNYYNKIPWYLRKYFVQKQIIKIIKPDYILPRFDINKENLEEFVAKKYNVAPWLVDSNNIYSNLVKLGITSVISNTPLKLKETH